MSIDKSTIKFRLYTTNEITLYRAKSFSTKEPETLKWIDKYGGRGVFYDIGANIGIYSIYHAIKFRNDIFAFEPSLFNLQILAKNINLNNLTDRIIIIPNPVSESNVVADFNLSSIEDGSAHSTFKEKWNQKGENLNIKFKYKTLGISLNHFYQNNLIPKPKIMKIDVDGIEHLILKGANKLFKQQNLDSILIEVHTEFIELRDSVESQLLLYGFKFNELESSVENQIWNRG